MQEAFDHCEGLVRAHDKDRFLAALFAPREKRQALFSLYAFDIEIARIPVIARQPLAGEVRLQWWREVLVGERGEEARASPIAAALSATLQGRPELIGPLEGLLEGRRADLYDDPVKTLSDLEEYAEGVCAPVIDVAIRLLGDKPGTETSEFAAHACKALLLERVARGSESTVARRMPPYQTTITTAALRERAMDHLERARALSTSMPDETWPAFLPLALVPLRLKKRDMSDAIPRAPQSDVPQWRRQWVLWRAARRRRL